MTPKEKEVIAAMLDSKFYSGIIMADSESGYSTFLNRVEGAFNELGQDASVDALVANVEAQLRSSLGMSS